MAYPRTIRNFNAFVDGVSYFGRVAKATLPELTPMTEEFRGGGMDAPVEVDLGMEAMSAELEFDEHSPALLQLLGTRARFVLRAGRGRLRGRQPRLHPRRPHQDPDHRRVRRRREGRADAGDGGRLPPHRARGPDHGRDRRAHRPARRARDLRGRVMTDVTALTRTLTLCDGVAVGGLTTGTFTLREPRGSDLRGLLLSKLVQGSVAAHAALIPRIAQPAISAAQVELLPMVDHLAIMAALQGFFAPGTSGSEAGGSETPGSETAWPDGD